MVSGLGRSLQFGLTSAPIKPHWLHTMRGSSDFSTTPAGQEISIDRRAMPAPQTIAIDQQPANAVLAHVS